MPFIPCQSTMLFLETLAIFDAVSASISRLSNACHQQKVQQLTTLVDHGDRWISLDLSWMKLDPNAWGITIEGIAADGEDEEDH